MNGAFIDALANHAKTLVTHVGLVNDVGSPVGGARQPVTWSGPTSGDGKIFPNADHDFTIAAGDNVAGWRGYDALSAGTDYDGDTLPMETFTGEGTYRLLAANTAIDLNNI